MTRDLSELAMAERNRELIAERLGHPPETVEACRDLERRFPDYMVWYASVACPASPSRVTAHVSTMPASGIPSIARRLRNNWLR